MKQKTNRLHFSTRTLAMVLSIVMLIGSIATGSMLNTFAAYLKDNANSDAVSQAASEGSDIAKSAIPSQNADADAANIAENNEDNNDAKDAPDLSDFEENEIVRGMKDDLADTGANIDLAETGFSTSLWFDIEADWDSWADHWVEPGTSYEIDLTNKAAGSEVEFAVKVNENGTDYWFKNGAVIYTQSGNNYSLTTNNNGSNNKFHVVKPCKIKVTPTWEGGGSSCKLTISSVTETSTEAQWYLIGGTSWGNWSTSNTTYPLTKNATTGYYEKEITIDSAKYFRVHNGTNQYNIGNVDRTAVTTSFQNLAQDTASAAMELSAGTWLLQVNDSGSTKQIRKQNAAKYTLAVPNVDWAEVSASYGGKSAKEGTTLTEIPAGASVSISILPDVGKTCTGITSTPTATITGSDHSWTLTMPSANVTNLSFTQGTVATKNVYFNNGNTLYSMMSAYVRYENGVEPLGPYPGKTMTRGSNSNIWSIEVPGDVKYITFIGDDGVNTGEMEIPWTHTNPKYTAPYGHNDAPTEDNGGTWGDYTNVNRTNQYTVSKGTNMDRTNIFTGISATMYDYYVDHEVDGTWRTSISGANNLCDFTVGDGSHYVWNPYTKLNSALSSYASDHSLTYPLYFGNLNVTSKESNNKLSIDEVGHSSSATIKAYTGWNQNINNSVNLSPTSKAVTGLTGQTLANGNIRAFKTGAANENGHFMAMFDDDFLSGENSQNKVLATILRSKNFPVRQITRSQKINFDISSTTWWSSGNAKVWAHLWDDLGNTKDVLISSWSSNIATISALGYTHVKFVRCKDNTSTTTLDWNNIWNRTGDLDIPTDGKVRWKTSSDSEGTTSGSWDTQSGAQTHTYYEFNSTNGKDNAYVTNIDTTNHTAKLSYYADSDNKKVHAAKVGDDNGAVGFFPFDYEQANTGDGGLAKDLGFGMKLEIPFTLGLNGLNEDGTAQTFDFSGDDDLWVFIDDQLVLDLGGAHDRTTGTINFNTKKITGVTSQKAGSATRNADFTIDTTANGVNTVHTMTIYYMERGMYDSNLKFGFSFHAVPEMLQVEKKVRTANINQGFFIANTTTTATDGSGNPIKNSQGKDITKFEYSYQADKTLEPFTITNTGTPNASNNQISYTIGTNTTTVNSSAGGSFNYTLYNDQIAYFSEQYKPGTSVKLKETIPSSSIYHYDQSFSLDNLADESAYSYTGDATDGYTFTMPAHSATGLDDIRMRARFTNQMKSHDLYVSKDVNDDNTTEEFTLNIKFKFGTDNYLAYPVYGTLDGEKAQLDEYGNITIKPGQVLRLMNIPENALVQITEAAETDDSEYLYKDITVSATGLSKTDITRGVQFKMGTGDVTATVNNVKYKYSFTYQYPSYSNLYSNQSYTIEGVINKKDMDDYFTLSANDLAFNSTASKTTFLNNKAPFENNFMDDLTLNTSVAQTEYDATNYLIKTTSSSPALFTTNPTKLSVTLKLPYEVTSNTNLTPKDADGEGYAPYVDSPAISMKDKFSFLDWLTVSGTGVAGGSENPQFVTAPLVLTTGSDSKAYKFSYWSVKSAGNDINGSQVEYTRCYSKEFNYVIFQDIVLEAVYEETTLADAIAAERAYDPVARQTTAGDNVTITFIENSRNQYNNFGAGSLSTNKKRNIAGDRMYSDFLLSFNNALGQTEVMNQRTDGTKCGVIIQAVGDLTFNGSSGYVTDLSKYTTLDSLATDTDLKTALESFVSNGTSGGKVNGITTAKSESNVTELDNKNRIEFYYGLTNKRDNTLDELANSKKLYRAFAYIKSGNTIKISDKPAYFTIFDMANIKVWGGQN